jgi:AbiV family abortive infection protein
VGKPLDYYRGLLSPAEIVVGLNAARRNAARFLEDAKLLFAHGRYPSAAALAILAIEEAGKVPILRMLPFAKTVAEAEEVWRDYRNHRAKNGAWVVLDWARGKSGTPLNFDKMTDKDAKHTEVLEAVKQISLYTDCLGNRQWTEPNTSVDHTLAEGLVHAADILGRTKEVSLREIELWVEHLSAAWNTPDMSNAIMRWAEAMEREKLSSVSAADFQKLLFNQAHFAELVRTRMKI